MGSLAVKWAQLAVRSPKAPQSPQFSDPVRICVCRLRTPPLDTWPSLFSSFALGSLQALQLVPLLFPSLGLAASFHQITPPTPVPPALSYPLGRLGAPPARPGLHQPTLPRTSLSTSAQEIHTLLGRPKRAPAILKEGLKCRE